MAVTEDDIKRLAGINKEALENYIENLDLINSKLREQSIAQQAIAVSSLDALQAAKDLGAVRAEIKN